MGYNWLVKFVNRHEGVTHMYIDPGTGGQLFAILAVAFGAISGAILVFSNRIKMFFNRTFRKKENETLEQEIAEIEEASDQE